MDYTKYSVEDFASDESFVEWVHHENSASARFWEKFAVEHPFMRLKIDQARTLVLNLKKAEHTRHRDEHIEQIWQGIENRILDEEIQPVRQRQVRRSQTGRFYALAAALVAAVSVAFIYALYPSLYTAHPAAYPMANDDAVFEEVNTSGSTLRIHLSDGSSVSLENNSRLQYRKDFSGGSARVVYLTGEAFFEVARDPARPFLVQTNDVVTRVLGTSFRVKAPDNFEEVVVSVKTGKVSVYTVESDKDDDIAQKNAVILLPNQQVTYLRAQESFGKDLVPEPDIVTAEIHASDFTFENTPAREVFRTLSKAYGIEIIFDDQTMSNCFFTAPLGSEPLFEKLKIICRTIGARYEVIDAKIVISGTGC